MPRRVRNAIVLVASTLALLGGSFAVAVPAQAAAPQVVANAIAPAGVPIAYDLYMNHSGANWIRSWPRAGDQAIAQGECNNILYGKWVYWAPICNLGAQTQVMMDQLWDWAQWATRTQYASCGLHFEVGAGYATLKDPMCMPWGQG